MTVERRGDPFGSRLTSSKKLGDQETCEQVAAVAHKEI